MKLVTALSLGFVSLNVFALPVLTQNQNEFGPVLFKDHLNPDVVYYIPDESELQEDTAIIDNHLKATFSLKNSKDLRYLIDQEERLNKTAELLPVTDSYYANKTDHPFRFLRKTAKPQLSEQIEFNGQLTVTGRIKLEKNPGSFMSACFEVKGVTPELKGGYVVNLKEVYRHFLSKSYSTLDYEKSRVTNELMKLVNKGMISFEVADSEAKLDDYLAVLTSHILEKLFVRDESSGLYKFQTFATVENEIRKTNFKNREVLKQDFCIDLKLNK